MSASAGWYGDPFDRFTYRYWDGTAWTDQVRAGAGDRIDPPGERPDPGPTWLRHVPAWLYRSPATRQAALQRPFTSDRVRRARLRSVAGLALFAGLCVVVIDVLHWPAGSLYGGFAAAVINLRRTPRRRWKQLFGLAPPDPFPTETA